VLRDQGLRKNLKPRASQVVIPTQMSLEACIKTNAAYKELDEVMEKKEGLHRLVLNLMKAVREEREATQKEIEQLRKESSVKAFYIQQLEKVRHMNHGHSDTLEKIENDLIRMLISTSDTLARVTQLRTTQ